MKIVEQSKGRLVLSHRGVLAEVAVLAFMTVFGSLAWIVSPVDFWLSMALFACVITAAVLFLAVSVRTTVIFDRIHTVVLIRRKTLFRTTERALPLAEVAEAMLLLEETAKPQGGGIIALAMRPGSRKPTVPLMPDALPDRQATAALGAINRWLAAV